MPEQTVEFSGTIQSAAPQKITGIGKIVSSDPSSRQMSFTTTNIVQISFAITISLTITLTFTFKLLWGDRASDLLKNTENTKSLETKEVPLPVECISAELRELGVDSYIVIVDVFDNGVDAVYLEYLLRQKRVHVKSLVCKSKHYVYVGPLYWKRRANSTLQAVRSLGYTKAYLLYPD